MTKSTTNKKINKKKQQTNSFLFGKNVLIAMVPILISKDVFDPSYNDLKFMIETITMFVPT